MGLTMGCARCHDHKFDPISTADYYALAGIFKSTRTMDSYKIVAQWHENSIADADELARKAAHEAGAAAKKKEIDEAVAGENARIEKERGDAFAIPKNAEATLYAPAVRERLKRLREEAAAIDKAAPEESTAMGVVDDVVADAPIHMRGSHLSLGEVVPRRVPTVFQESSSVPDLRRRRERPAGAGPLAVGPRASAHRPRDGQPDLALAFRQGARRHSRQLRTARRGADPSRTARLAGAPVRRRRLVDQGDAPSHPAVVDLSDASRPSTPARPRSIPRTASTGGSTSVGSRPRRSATPFSPSPAPSTRRMGGSMLKVKNREYFFNHTSKDVVSYDSDRDVRSTCRSSATICTTSSSSSTTPTPSVLNGDRAEPRGRPAGAVHDEQRPGLSRPLRPARRRLLDDPRLDDEGRVGRLYEIALGRPARPEEVARARGVRPPV